MYFLDTSYLLALELKNDQYHEQAQQHWQKVLAMPPALLTTSYIFDEVVTFFNSRSAHEKAHSIGTTLLSSAFIQFVFVDERLFHEGWVYFQQHTDKSYSFTDCVSFIVMREQTITTALTFDHHFTQAGFQREPN